MVIPFELLSEKMSEFGFEIFGIIQPQNLPHFNLYQSWINDEYFGQMKYLAQKDSIALRKNITKIWRECKSVIVAGFSYPSITISHENFDSNKYGLIAAYACQIDYHHIIKKFLWRFISELTNDIKIDIKAKVFCDTAPILEKEHGFLAGLGWVGKNSLLINPNLGSYFNIGLLLLNQEISSYTTKRMEDYCGDCNLCIEACPTHCIQENRTIDAKKCISYLTIENKEYPPDSLKETLRNRVFGCDICQDVCPWNSKFRRTHLTTKPALNPFFDLSTLNHFTEENYHAMVTNTPMARISYTQFLRNCIIAIGNNRQTKAKSFLTNVLSTSTETGLKELASWAIHLL